MEWVEDTEACTGVRRYSPISATTGMSHFFRFIHRDAAHDLEFLVALRTEGHWTHLGHYDNDRMRGAYFMTTNPDVNLSGWNIFIYPLSQWIEWAKQPAL